MNEEKIGGSSELKPLIDAIDAHLLRLTTKSVYREDIKQRILEATAQVIDKEFDEIFAKLKPANEAIHKLKKHSGKKESPTNQVQDRKSGEVKNAIELIKKFAAWSRRYSRSTIYPTTEREKIDGELVELEEKAKEIVKHF